MTNYRRPDHNVFGLDRTAGKLQHGTLEEQQRLLIAINAAKRFAARRRLIECPHCGAFNCRNSNCQNRGGAPV